jgi:hypothetical protein
MSNVKFNALASLALLAGAPVVAQAEMVEMGDTELSGVSGEGLVTNLIDVLTPGPVIPAVTALPATTVEFCDGLGTCTTTFNPAVPGSAATTGPFIGKTIAKDIGGAAGDATKNVIGFHLLPLTGPSSAVGAFNGEVIDNSKDLGSGVADFAFMTPFRLLDLASQGKSTALDYLLFPISAPLDIASNVFSTVQDTVVGKTTAFIFAPFNLAMGPVNRVVGGAKGRVGATVDGAAYAFTEVGGGLITGAFASASQGAANNGLGFTSRVFGRIAQAQAGLTTNRLSALSGKYGY